MLPNNSPVTHAQTAARGERAGARAGREKPGGVRRAREQGTDRPPRTYLKEVGVGERNTGLELSPQLQCTLHCPIRLHIQNRNSKATLLRMVKLFMKLSCLIIIERIKGKNIKTVGHRALTPKCRSLLRMAHF